MKTMTKEVYDKLIDSKLITQPSVTLDYINDNPDLKISDIVTIPTAVDEFNEGRINGEKFDTGTEPITPSQPTDPSDLNGDQKEDPQPTDPSESESDISVDDKSQTEE